MVGIDEAGYGPTLGPLVIGASLWRIPSHTEGLDPFASWLVPIEITDVGTIRIDDSKKLYSTTHGLKQLEASVWGAVAQLSVSCPCFRSLLQYLCTELHSFGDPWYGDWEPQATSVLSPVQWKSVSEAALAAWGRASAKLIRVAATILEPKEFNRLCDERGNKAVVLTEQSLLLAKQLMEFTDGESVEIFCDKHGGRNYYAAPLWHYWPDVQITIEKESREHSRYHVMDRKGRAIIWNFTAKGDGYVPTALASMIAKYLRERMMEAFNAYWLKKLPELKPTAGYPSDAIRFLQAIEPLRSRLGIELATLRRAR